MPIENDVTIIGGGWSGLLACKHMIENGLKPVVLESRSSIGGVWRYSDDPEITTVMTNTRTTSSRCITEMSDFPMSDDYPNFPSHSEVIQYLDSYVEEFDLAKYIRCNSKAISTDKVDEHWHVVDENGEVYRSRFLLVCSGLHSEPNLDTIDSVFKDFSAEILHSGGYKHPTESMHGKRILVFGGGETSSDIAYEISSVASEVHYSMRNGAWFLRRSMTREDDMDALDSWSSPLRTVMSPTDKGAIFPLMVLNNKFGDQGHGQMAWCSPTKYYGQFFNKSDDVLMAVEEGTVQPRPGVSSCSGNTVSFSDGTSAEIDLVILCTGYRRNFNFMPEYNTPTYRHYLFVFNNDDPTLAFTGFVRPVVTSIPFMTEQQMRMVSGVFSGRIKLPDKETRNKEIELDIAEVEKRYRDTSKRIDGLVDPQWYTRRISKAAGTFPRFYKLFLRHPLLCLKFLRLPAHGGIFMINAAMHSKQELIKILDRYEKYRPRPTYMRFYLDTCGGWILVRVFEDVFRLWQRIMGNKEKYW